MSVEIENVWLRKEGKDKLVLSVNVDGKDYVILREPIPVDGELSHCVHDSGILSIIKKAKSKE